MFNLSKWKLPAKIVAFFYAYKNKMYDNSKKETKQWIKTYYCKVITLHMK